MPTDLPRFESNERVDLPDFTYMVDEGVQGLIRHVNEEFLTDPSGSVKSWILDGFAMANLGAGQLQVTKGRAMLAQREGSQVHYGALTTEGDATKTLDLSGYGNATYNVYLRFQYVDASTQSRLFWNPAGAGTEFAQTIQTRRQANWSFRAELASPGTEWTKIGEVTIAAAVITTIKDMRNHYFEGAENSETCLGNWNWNGTTTVTATDTTQVAVNDWVAADSDGQYFKITAETPNVDVTIENPHGYTIPNLGVTASSFVLAADELTYKTDWGSAADRNMDRKDHGVKDLRTFCAAVRQLFEDLRPTDGRWWEKRGLEATGLSGTSEPGVKGTASGSSNTSVGVEGVGDVSGAATTCDGVKGTGAGTDGHGTTGVGAGTGPGVKGTASGGNNLSVGVEGVGDVSGAATTSDGIAGTGAGTDGHGTTGVGAGTGPGVKGTASGANNASVGIEGVGDVSGAATTSDGVSGTGAGTDGHGVVGQGNLTGPGVKGTGGLTGYGVEGYGGATSGYGLYGFSASASSAIWGQANGTGSAIKGFSSDIAGSGVYGEGAEGYGVTAKGKNNPTVTGRASLMIEPQTGVPNTLDNGAMWIQTDTNLAYIRINGVTKTFAFV